MGAGCEVRDLVKVFAGKRVVDHGFVSIDACEFLIMLGPLGYGKTTTLRMSQD